MNGLDLGQASPHRRASLAPMIDVVFLLLIFFMLAARFGIESAVPLAPAGGGAGYAGPPRLVTITPDGLRLNGVPVAEAALASELALLGEAPDSVVVLRPIEDARTERVVAVVQRLASAGFRAIALVE